MRELIGLGQLRSNACKYLERVAAGETIEVVRRGKLVARIVSVGDWRVVPIPAGSVRGAALDAGGWVGLSDIRAQKQPGKPERRRDNGPGKRVCLETSEYSPTTCRITLTSHLPTGQHGVTVARGAAAVHD